MPYNMDLTFYRYEFEKYIEIVIGYKRPMILMKHNNQ